MEFKYKEDYPSNKAIREELSKLTLEELEEICKREEEKLRKQGTTADAKEQKRRRKHG